jgi:hypothetical protein
MRELEWSAAFDGISLEGDLDLGESIRDYPMSQYWKLSTTTLEDIAERINSLSIRLAESSEGWTGKTSADTGLPTVTVRELPSYCPEGNPDCVFNV